MVFWLMAWIPRGIMDKIRKNNFQIFWSDREDHKGMAWMKWKKLHFLKVKEDGEKKVCMHFLTNRG